MGNNQARESNEAAEEIKNRLFQLLRNEKTFEDDTVRDLVLQHAWLCRTPLPRRFPAVSSVSKSDFGLETLSRGWGHREPSLLMRICSLRPSLGLVKLVHQEHPSAIRAAHSRNGWLPLHTACRKGASIDVIRYLVSEYGESVRTKEFTHGWQPLHVACRTHAASPEVIRFLLSQHEDAIADKDSDGFLPLHACVHWRYSGNEDMEIIRYLVSLYPSAIKSTTSSGMLPLHLVAFHNANTNPMELIRYLISEYPEGIKAKDIYGDLPIHIALRNEAHPLVLEHLVSAYESCAIEVNRNGQCPLHLALGRRKHPYLVSPRTTYLAPPSVIYQLLRANRQAVVTKDFQGKLSLHIALENQAPLHVILHLVSEFPRSILETHPDGYLPAQWVIRHEAAQKLIPFLVSMYPQAICDMRSQCEPDHFPVHDACKMMKNRTISSSCDQFMKVQACLPLVRLLVTAYPQGIEERNTDGLLPLHIACGCGAPLELIRYLVSTYPQSIRVKSPAGLFPVHLALSGGSSLETIHYLVSEFRNDIKDQVSKQWVVSQITGNHLLPAATLERICLLISEYPEWLESENSDAGNEVAFDISQTHHPVWLKRKDIFVKYCGDGLDMSEKISEVFESVMYWVGWGGGMDSRGVPHISNGLEDNRTLVHLGLGHHPIGDSGADLLATALLTNRTLRSLYVDDCSIGDAGLNSLLQTLEVNHVLQKLNLSYNAGIFNHRGGRAITALLSKRIKMINMEMVGLRFEVACGSGKPPIKLSSSELEATEHTKIPAPSWKLATELEAKLPMLHLYRNEDEVPSLDLFSFLAELMDFLRFGPRPPPTGWQIFLNRLPACAWASIEYFNCETVHRRILSAKSETRLLLCHFILERVGVLSQNNAGVLYSYVQDLGICQGL